MSRRKSELLVTGGLAITALVVGGLIKSYQSDQVDKVMNAHTCRDLRDVSIQPVSLPLTRFFIGATFDAQNTGKCAGIINFAEQNIHTPLSYIGELATGDTFELLCHEKGYYGTWHIELPDGHKGDVVVDPTTKSNILHSSSDNPAYYDVSRYLSKC